MVVRMPSISVSGLSTISNPAVTTASNPGAVTATNYNSNARIGSIENQIRRAGEQNKAYLEEAKALYEPYAAAGTSSLDEYMKLLLGGVDSLSGDRNFRAMQDLAERKVMANRATSGLLRSGATAAALDDTLLQFANQYYGNRLNQLKEGVGIGQYGTSGTSSILEKLGGNETDLASALANIQMQREANNATINAARAQAGATTDAANKAAESNLIGSAIGALGTIGAAAAIFSDRRLKTDLKLVGKSANGLNIYLGRYTKESGLDDSKQHLFLIAQEVQEVIPEAVVEDESGYLKVDYAKALGE